MTFKNIAEIKRANRAGGHYWFSPDTIRFFGAKVETPVIGGFYWVESTDNYDNTRREFLAVGASPTGDISYLRGGERFTTKEQALAVINDIVENRND